MIFEKISKLASEKGILISSLEKTLGFGNEQLRSGENHLQALIS